MKKIIIVTILCIATAITSCNKLLDEDIRSQVTDSYINTPTGFEDAVKASYSFLKTFYGSEAGATLTVFGTDTYTNGADGSNKSINFYDNNFNARNGVTTNTWNDMYVAINSCNAVITRGPEVTGIDETLKTTRLAEAHFLRAHYYFILVRLYGPVHLTVTETQGVIKNATRSPINEVYDQIIQDLDFAVLNLPNVATNYGRATKPAAEFLLSKVYLTRASSTAAQPTDYAKAAELAKSVINNYGFKLLDDFSKVFEQGAGEKSTEVVWSVQNSQDPLTVGAGNTLHLYFIMEYDVAALGMTRDIANGRPFKRFRPTEFTMQQLFDKLHDARYEKSFKRVFLCNRPGNITTNNGKPVTLKLGDTAIFISDKEYTPAERAAFNYNVYSPSQYNERVFPTLNKFLDPQRRTITDVAGSRDYLAFRLAEAYLIAAEGLMMSGNAAEAATLVNIVRSRAAIKTADAAVTAANLAAMQVTPDQLNIDFILDERAREFLGEQMRWFDLVRTGKLVERVKKYNPSAATGVQDFHVLRPIPQDQIDRTEGGKEAFPQNAGYN